MTRFRSLAIALTALALSAGAAFAFTDLPEQALERLASASEHADRDLPARPATLPVPADTHSSTAADNQVDLTAEDLPEAADHGAAVSEAAKPDEPPVDSDHGKAVSEIARDNHGTATAAEHKPANAGSPEGAGKPDNAGKPDDPGPPDSVEIPDAAPEDPGPPADPGKPADPGRPNYKALFRKNPARHSPPTSGVLLASKSAP
jgi:hypothetical protein